MAHFWDSRNTWLNDWAKRHVLNRPGDAFPREDSEFWAKLDEWIVNFSHWAVRYHRLALDPIEVAEEVRDRVLMHSAAFRGEGSLTAWLQGCGFHVIWSMKKLGRNAKTTFLEDEIRARGDQAMTGTDASNLELFGGEPKRVLARLLAELPRERDAKILYLRRIENWTDDEIAAKLNLSCSAVHAAVARAMRRLRTAATGQPTAEKKSVYQRVRAKHAAS